MTTLSRGIMQNLFSRLSAALNKQRAHVSGQAWESSARIRLWAGRTFRRKSPHPAEAVIFSKDRALQLHGLLCSLLENVSPRVPVQVLYDCSAPGHAQAYDDVRKIFSTQDIIFVRQRDQGTFREDLLAVINNVRSDRIFFLVDDIVFTGRAELEMFSSLDPARYVASLRMGLNVKRCYTMQQEQPLPPLQNDPAAGADTICWKWREGMFDWNYPLSVDGHFFSTGEIRAMLRMVDFRAPNSLEHVLQRFRPLFLIRLGIAYRRSRIVNIPCNKVQLENSNICGNLHQDDLLAHWQQGMQMDVRRFQGFVSESAHQDVEIPLTRREAHAHTHML